MQGIHPSLARRWDLLLAFATRDLRTRFYNMKLAAIHTFGVSLSMMVVLSVVLGRVFRASVEGPYAIFVFAALIPWNFLSASISQSSESFRQSGPLLRKVPFPRELVPLGVVAANTLNMLISFGAFVPIALFFGIRPGWTWLALPIILLILVGLASGVAMLVATAGVFYLETRPLLDVVLMLGFYATPVFYPVSIVPDRFQWVLTLNPIAHLVTVLRTLLISGHWPAAADVAYPALFALAAWLGGRALLRKYQGIIPDHVG